MSDYPQPPTQLSYISTFTTVKINWKFQLNGSSPRIGVKVEIRSKKKINSMTVNPGKTSAFFDSLSPLTIYSINVYVVSDVGNSLPSRIEAITLFPSK